jgi:hypothetical protein
MPAGSQCWNMTGMRWMNCAMTTVAFLRTRPAFWTEYAQHEGPAQKLQA